MQRINEPAGEHGWAYGPLRVTQLRYNLFVGLGNGLEQGVAEWFYIGHYGQLGPLTRDQMSELIEGGVIARDTYVWKSGMSDWLHADKIPDLQSSFSIVDPFVAPPPPPGNPPRPFSTVVSSSQYANPPSLAPSGSSYLYSGLRSDKSRVLGGLLNFIPGVGRIYLGYSALGVLQIVVTIMTCGLGILWPIIDGVIILCGGVKMDGYGRQLVD